MKDLLKVFSHRRIATVLFLGFSSGLPLVLTAGGSTIQAWMKDAKVDLATIGRFSLIGLPYALKFLWAPLIDTLVPPFLGRRRGWGIITQIGLMFSLALVAFSDPTTSLPQFILGAVLISFFSASQDIVTDALRTELLEKDEIGPGASVYLMGYRLAMLVSGAGALALSTTMPWKTVYLSMAALMGVGMLTLVFIEEPNVPIKRHESFRNRVILPFAEFFKRDGAMEVMGFVMLYKLPTLMATALTTVFLMSLGFEKIEIAAVSKVAGLIATIVGTLAGGAMMVKLGVKYSLWVFGVAQALGGALFILLAVLGKNHAAMIGVIVADNFLMGMGTAAIVGFMMSICSKKFTGTQYALLSSLTAFTRVILIAPAGEIAKSLGWVQFFVFSVFLAIPGLLLLIRFDHWKATEASDAVAAKLESVDIFVMTTFLGGLIVISTDFVWPKLGLPDVALRVGSACLFLSVCGWALKTLNKRRAV